VKNTHKGSCHCGAVQFECDLDLAQGTSRCNCSFCKKARFWMAIVKDKDFRLLAGDSLLSDYQHTPAGKPGPFLHLCFCSRCGMRPFSRGGVLPQLGSAFYAVNIACLDDLSDEALAQVPVRFVDGRHDRFAEAPAVYSHL
jgi:hypothetical protein